MKIFKPLLLIVMIISLVSCNNDDDSNDFLLNNENLAGVYEIDYLRSVDVETILFNEIPVTSTTTTEGDTFQIDWIFNENGTFTVEGQFREVSTTVVGNKTTVDTEILLVNDGGTYVLDANDQTIALAYDDDNAIQIYDIILFNENILQINFEESFSSEDYTNDFFVELGLSR